MSNKVCGGPSWQKVTCPKCETKHIVYRGGSWDWKPALCKDCKLYQFLLDIDDKKKDGKIDKK